jgi:hypothetical protein
MASAQPFGFGPVAKLVGVASLLQPFSIEFFGRGIALRYAELNNEHFTNARELDLADLPSTRRLVRDHDAVLSVMEPHLIYACVREDRPGYFFDSLFGFWLTHQSFAELAQVARTIRTGTDAKAEAAFRALPAHESMIVSHMLATESYVQSFPGVAERIRTFGSMGFDTVRTTGPMLDVSTISRLRGSVPAAPRTLLVNLGGFTNAFLDYAKRGSYVDIVLRWLAGVAERSDAFDRIVVCSGAFRKSSSYVVNNVQFLVGLLPHRQLLETLAARPVYLTAPGLTSLHEAVAMEVPAMLLPDQHYGHTHNRRSLAGTALGRHGASFADLRLGVEVPDDDLEGTLALAEVAAAINREPAMFGDFAGYLDARLAAFCAMTSAQAADYVGELEELLAGPPINEIVAGLRERMPRAAAQLPFG